MSSKFFSRRIAFFGNIALVILCVIFFLVPFGFRGARMAVDEMRNDVKDWLPNDFKETEELRWFHKYFIGSSFVIVTWPGANEDDPTFHRLVEELRAETKPTHDELDDPNLSEEEYARRNARLVGDKLGLFIDVIVDDKGIPIEDDLNEDWGGLGEKWLTGDENKRYFITPNGELFLWTGKSNLIGFLKRKGERLITGANEAKGVLVDKFGEPSKPGKPNEFHQNPRLLTARLFQTIQTGPDVLNELAGEGGSLRPYKADESDEESGAARDLAYKRLSGLLFGPVVPEGFTWELDDFKRICPERRLARLPRGWEQHYARYVDELLKARFADRHTHKFLQQYASQNSLDKEGLAKFKKTQSEDELQKAVFEAFKADYDRDNELARLVDAPQNVQADHWNAMFVELGRQCPGSFKWTLEDFEKVLSAAQRSSLEFRWKDKLQESIERLVDEQYGGNPNALEDAPEEEQRLHWEAIFQQLNYPAPEIITWDVIEFSNSIVYKQETNDLRNRWKDDFDSLIRELADLYYDGDPKRLALAPADEQLGHWQSLLTKLGLESDTAPPARQTCVVATLSEPGLRDFSRIIGRKVLGKPLGRILQIATYAVEKGGLVGIDPEELRIGGPPVDNVAIDEEGKITLARLVSFSALVGLTLAMICFRSFKVTIMIFFVGGVSAACSLGIVWWCGSSVDAILMTMPSLVYVLGLSGAVHIVNYYRDAAQESGLAGAPETAIGHGWFPCTLAAFTTSLGLISLYFGSNVIPIQKFGLFSAIGTLATVLLLFTFLPSALQLWPPGYHKEAKGKKPRSHMGDALTRFWELVGGWIVRRHWWVTAACTLALVAFAFGLPKIRTSVHLLKLFDGDARIIEDYTWIEGHLGKLVPMELIVGVDKEMQRPTLAELEKIPPSERDTVNQAVQYSFLERAVMADRIQRVVEDTFGGELDVVGNGMSTGTLIPPLPNSSAGNTTLLGFNGQLERNRDTLLKQDYLKVDKQDGRELWRISLRLGSLNDIDYGLFVSELKKAVEPILSAYRYRTQILHNLYDEDDSSKRKRSVLVLGGPTPEEEADEEVTVVSAEPVAQDELHFDIDQTRIFCETLNDLFLGRDFRFPKRGRRMPDKAIVWHIPETQPLEKSFPDKEKWAKWLGQYDSVVLVRDHADYDVDFIKENSQQFVDARNHVFVPEQSLTATERRNNGEADANVAVTYTGIVPIVYKAQRTLLESLINSIGLAFVMIAIVMMILLRDWRSRPSLKNSLNVGGGLASMIPNVFPIVIIFGAMGHMGTLVDIGTMMTASVAMGIAVDDTIHFLNWYRHGLGRGMERKQAIALAYNRCATAMTQTTLIGGFGLAVFAFSTFVPTQKFGTMMLTLLAAALVGDLLFLPSILAGPLGPLFGKTRHPKPESESESQPEDSSTERATDSIATRHSGRSGQTQGARVRQDSGHKLPGET